MRLDVNQEIITPRVPQFSAELNVEFLGGKHTTQLKTLIVNPNGRMIRTVLSTTRRAFPDVYCSFLSINFSFSLFT